MGRGNSGFPMNNQVTQMENNSAIKNENSSMNIIRALLVAFFLAIGAPLAGADGSDPLDPSDGGVERAKS